MATHNTGEHAVNVSSLQLTKSPAICRSPTEKLSQKGLFIAQAFLRIFSVVCSVAAIFVLVTSDRTFSVYGIKLTAHYYYSSASRFLLGADIVVCIFSAVSLIFAWVSRRSRTTEHPKYCFFLFFHDMVMMVLMISGCAAATSVGYIARYGEEKMGWNSVCQNVPNFCNQTMASLFLSYFVFFSYFVLTTISAHTLIFSTLSHN